MLGFLLAVGIGLAMFSSSNGDKRKSPKSSTRTSATGARGKPRKTIGKSALVKRRSSGGKRVRDFWTGKVIPTNGRVDMWTGKVVPRGGRVDVWTGKVVRGGGRVDAWTGKVVPRGGHVDLWSGKVVPRGGHVDAW
eukprot:CAMPEP_0169431360 /NCGR_PEP_ID=MMETSP1042-20121227/2904_1 /TAXON_ID=464988 /ORGANISM="Hemiselmis andersenii, Strain CCMP1180" /LENGTH=135 /DNA_ID=CAMNT_0009541763 /DNA_START=952 /DNA_END=1356 /DNA_ORIENTATION=-